ncbi:MAG: hypothetical protein IKX36_06000 [Prevotella sp.]|nr:hypothetical protein [Prevotella sp.]
MKKLMIMAAMVAMAFTANAQDVKKDISVEQMKAQGKTEAVATKKVVKQRDAATLKAEPEKAIQRKEVKVEKKEAGATDKKLAPATRRNAPVKPVEPKSQDITKELEK